ncbi:MAG TPA: response regulator transcription factor [Candidatus Obscuribacterales bacterium]
MSEETHSTAGPSIRALLVEDHLLTRIGLKTVIDRTTDIKVVGEASNGEEAVQSVDQLKPDIVLMDVGMPVMDGIEASRKILEKHPDVKIIMLTSHDNDRDIFASLAAGASGYCLKDVEPDRLYTAIRSVSSGDVWLDSSIANRVLLHYAAQTKPSPAPSPEAAAAPPTRTEPPTAGRQPLPEPLSQRELEVLRLVVDGLSNQEIADRLIISLATAKTHVRNILNKLAVDDRTQAAVQAMRRGLV